MISLHGAVDESSVVSSQCGPLCRCWRLRGIAALIAVITQSLALL